MFSYHKPQTTCIQCLHTDLTAICSCSSASFLISLSCQTVKCDFGLFSVFITHNLDIYFKTIAMGQRELSPGLGGDYAALHGTCPQCCSIHRLLLKMQGCMCNLGAVSGGCVALCFLLDVKIETDKKKRCSAFDRKVAEASTVHRRWMEDPHVGVHSAAMCQL